jgi:3'-5' exoribonuclease
MTPLEKLLKMVEVSPRVAYKECLKVLCDPSFAVAPASAGHHPGPHQEPGGLALHTLEVAEHAVALAGDDELLARRALIAAVFHDYGKIHEYEFVDGKAVKTEFHKRTGHVVWSWYIFMNLTEGTMSEEWREEIGHALLAHHGRREWGSPVEPQTRLAYILHTADMLSSRGVTE